MIEFESVAKTYRGGAVAVADFSLTIPSHRTVVLVGSSGSGKTTLLRMVNRMVDPTSGHVLIDDEDVRDANPVRLRRSIGYVLQTGGLLPHRTVADNVATVRVLNGESRRKARAGAAELLERVGLDPSLGSRYPAQLSGGQQQRAALARILVGEPEIILLDEPFSALDAITKDEMHEWYMNMRRKYNTSTIFITHDVDEAILLSDRIYILGNTPSTIKTELKIEVNNRNNDFKLSESFLEYKKEVLRNLENDGDGKKF